MKDTNNCNSQYFLILSKLQNAMSYMYYENGKVINNSPASNGFQSLSETAQRYFYKYFSIVLIPIPSVIGILINNIK